jgi:hypothetical protein
MLLLLLSQLIKSIQFYDFYYKKISKYRQVNGNKILDQNLFFCLKMPSFSEILLFTRLDSILFSLDSSQVRFYSYY